MVDEENDDLIEEEKVNGYGLDLFIAFDQFTASSDGNDVSTSPLEKNQQEVVANGAGSVDEQVRIK